MRRKPGRSVTEALFAWASQGGLQSEQVGDSAPDQATDHSSDPQSSQPLSSLDSVMKAIDPSSAGAHHATTQTRRQRPGDDPGLL